MKRTALFAGIIFSAAGAACADEMVLVRAGEHGEYSRVVIPHAPSGWSVAAGRRQVEIALPGANDYVLTELVEKRLAHRVLSAHVEKEEDATNLALTLNCDCVAHSSFSADGSIVIDIRHREQESASTTPAIDDGDNGIPQDNFRAARDRMIALLAEANGAGVIKLKNSRAREQQTLDIGGGETIDTPPSLPTSAKTNNNTLYPPAECFGSSYFRKMRDDPALNYQTISDLSAKLDTASDVERIELERELASVYIRLGFFEEANAIASPRSGAGDIEMELLSALAAIGGASDANMASAFSALAHCGVDFEILLTASDARLHGTAPAYLTDAHFDALQNMTVSLQLPIAEILAIAALDNGDTEIARRLNEIAATASNGEKSPALTILDVSLATPPENEFETNKGLVRIAQSPGAMQSRALKEIAKSSRTNADVGYDGFLDDIAALGDETAKSHKDPDALTMGANALAVEGRINDAFTLLQTLARNDPEARAIAQNVASSILISAIDGTDTQRRYKAINAYLSNNDFLSNANVTQTIAKNLAAHGAEALTGKTLLNIGGIPQDERSEIIAGAHFYAGAYDAAASMLGRSEGNPVRMLTPLRALERMGDPEKVKKHIRSINNTQNTTPAIAQMAWRTGDWKLTTQTYGQMPSAVFETADAKRYALAAIAAGELSTPIAAANVLNETNELEPLAHMHIRAPNFSMRRVEPAANFASGIGKEITFMKRELAGE